MQSLRPSRLATAAGLTALVVAGYLVWATAGGRADSNLQAAPAARARSDSATGRDTPSAIDGALRAGSSEGVQRVQTLLTEGWLKGTEVDGDWSDWQGGQLQPSLSLRRRFDYLLNGVGEVEPAELRQWIAAEVTAQRGPDGAAAVLAVWDAYVALRRRGAEAGFDINDADSWQRAQAVRSRQRVEALGPAWAYAFFAEEDRQTGEFVQRRVQAKAAAANGAAMPAVNEPLNLVTPPDAPLTTAQATQRNAQRVATFGAEAAERMRAVDADWDHWQQRLADARQRLQEIDRDAQLSAPQRAQERQAALTGRFSGSELMRAQLLLTEKD